jgi:hypothetical protein
MEKTVTLFATITAAEMPSYDLFRTHAGIDSFLKIERASLMWISNQSDDLLCFRIVRSIILNIKSIPRCASLERCAAERCNPHWPRSWQRAV